MPIFLYWSKDLAGQLRKAVTIATRYSSVRHQSELVPGYWLIRFCQICVLIIHFIASLRGPEPQILDYVAQQNKLFPPLAATFAFQFAASYVWELYNTANESIAKGDLQLMPDVSLYWKLVEWFLSIKTCTFATINYFISKNTFREFNIYANSFMDYLVRWKHCVQAKRLTTWKYFVSLVEVMVTWVINKLFFKSAS